MLAKNSLQQQQQQSTRRTPLSLSASVKPTKSNNDKNDSNKKETTNNQKTDNNSKKDFQQEKKFTADNKKQSWSESKKSTSSTSSTDSKKVEANNKFNKNEDNKKNQNGVNGNGPKDKTNANESVAKPKPEPSSNGNASKTVEKKKDPVVDVAAAVQNDKKEKPTEQVKESKNEENKSAEKNKEKTVDAANSNLDKEKTNGKNEQANADSEKKETEENVVEEKNAAAKSPEKTKAMDEEVSMVVLESNDQTSLSTQTQMTEETSALTTQDKGKNEEDTQNVDNLLTDDLLEDVMMEPLEFTDEPTPSNIFAVSTPAKSCSPKEAQSLFEQRKLSPKSEIKPASAPLTHTPDRKSCPRTFSAISGRRSIRPIGDYTFSGNLQIRESYRKINTELDFTNSSLNVTVGSEVPNNESFSFFSRSRKRDRSSPSLQSAMEVQNELSPKSPKRARIDMGMSGFFNAMASPITMLRARLARASVQSTPKKQIMDSLEQEIVENVSAIAVEAVEEEATATEEQTFNPDSTVADTNEPCEEPAKYPQNPAVEEIDDIKIKETITATDSQAKKKCSIM